MGREFAGLLPLGENLYRSDGSAHSSLKVRVDPDVLMPLNGPTFFLVVCSEATVKH